MRRHLLAACFLPASAYAGDTDRDGIPNHLDACVDDRGPRSNSGCPDVAAAPDDGLNPHTPVDEDRGTPAPAPSPAPTTVACRPAGPPLALTVANNVSSAVTVRSTDACGTTSLGPLASRAEGVLQSSVGASVEVTDAAGTVVQRFRPLAQDAPALRIPARAFSPSGESCHGEVVGIEPWPGDGLHRVDFLFRCDRTVANQPFRVDMWSRAPSAMPTPGTRGTITYTDLTWRQFTADDGRVFQTESAMGDEDE